MNKRTIYLLIIIVLLVTIIGIIIFEDISRTNNNSKEDIVITDNDFTLSFIKNVNKEKLENYLVSPYSVEVALNMLKSGSSGNTLDELNKVLSKRNLKISNDNVKIANGIFIKDKYKNDIKDSFTNNLKTNFNAEILYDEFTTPNVINNWVNDKTNGMINKILDDISPDFVLGLANAIAIDAKWESVFECISTTSETFNKVDGKKINVQMMHKTYQSGIKYLDGDTKGVVIPYQENLEFIGLLPNNNVQEYISSLSKEKLDNILNSFKDISSKERVLLSLPRFSYSYDLKDFQDILVSMGIKDAFDSSNANFSNIISPEIEELYVSDAIHKTYIDLNEKGTKAAAVTYFGLDKNSASYTNKYKDIKIEFNRPFIYMIRDTASKEILFFGTVYEPNIWNGSTCE